MIREESEKATAEKKVSAIFQVRMGSTRLPGKVLIEIEGKPLLQHVVERVARSKHIDEIILATTTGSKDIPILEFAQKQGLKCFAGSEEDVLDRFYKCAETYSAQNIVRITPDDPFKDPEVIDKGIEIYNEGKGTVDYVTNTLPPTYPIGLDIEVFSFSALYKAWNEATKISEREHVTPYIWNHPQLFNIKNFSYEKDISGNHWTLDTEKDLSFTREIYRRLYPVKQDFLMADILELLFREPKLSEINFGADRFDGYKKSLEKDKQYERHK